MNKTKFRGRDANGSWVYGDVHFGQANARAHIHPVKGSNQSIEVEVETVGQFIGSKDQNAEEIYDGSLVKYFSLDSSRDFVVYKVMWDVQKMGWVLSQEGLSGDEGLWVSHWSSSKAEVIGDIHTNE